MMPEFRELSEALHRYFPGLVNETQLLRFRKAFEAYLEWNPRINVISRKDIENLTERHFLHSLAIAKVFELPAGSQVLDFGTGGGFPGIPLAIFFPEVDFHLVDSRSKKMQVVQEVVQAAGLKNVRSTVSRVEEMTGKYDYITGRAVAAPAKFLPWLKGRIRCGRTDGPRPGILYLLGGEVETELRTLRPKPAFSAVHALSEHFEGAFFSTKSLLHLSYCK